MSLALLRALLKTTFSHHAPAHLKDHAYTYYSLDPNAIASATRTRKRRYYQGNSWELWYCRKEKSLETYMARVLLKTRLGIETCARR